jgi:ATP synthase protein I
LSGDIDTVGASPEINPLSAMSRILLAQLGAGLVLAVAGWSFVDATAGYSALLGGLICVVPNAFLALRMVTGTMGGDPRRALTATYIGVVGKLILTATLFAAVFVLVRPLRPGWLFSGFLAAQGVIWISLARSGMSDQSTRG